MTKPRFFDLRYCPCLVCGVDSGPVLRLFIFFVGAGLLGTLCILFWGVLSDKFSMGQSPAFRPLEVEKEERP